MSLLLILRNNSCKIKSDSRVCASVGRISEALSDTVKYLANYYQYFMLLNGWRVPLAYIQKESGKRQDATLFFTFKHLTRE